MTKLPALLGSSALTLLLASPVLAQDASVDTQASTGSDEAAEVDVETEVEESDASTESKPAPPEDSSTKPSAESSAQGISDHEQMVGHFAVGYMGRQTIILGVPQTDPAERIDVVAPIIGARYWMNPLVGLDLGLGFNASGGKNTDPNNPDEQVNKVGITAILIHVGVPLSLAHHKHFSFQVVPEANVGFARTGDQDPNDDNTERDSGFHLSAGARAGAEVQFGFMDLPQLSLQGSVGLYFQMDSTTNTQVVGDNRTKLSDTAMTVGTSVGSDPWDIFTSNISALYYF